MRALQLYQHLTEVIKRGLFRQVPLVVKHLSVDLDERDDIGRTPIMLCAYVIPENCGVSLARTLIEKGCSLELRDKYGLSVLHYACIYERLQLTRVLLRALQSSANVKDHFGCTPLHYAVRAGNPDITNLLTKYFKYYGLPLTNLNKEGKSPLQLANQLGHTVCAEILCNAISNKDNSYEIDLNATAPNPSSNVTQPVAVVGDDANAHLSIQQPSEVSTPMIEAIVESSGENTTDYCPITAKEFISPSKSSKTTEKTSTDKTTKAVVCVSEPITKTDSKTPLKSLTVTTLSSQLGKGDGSKWGIKRASQNMPVSASTSLSVFDAYGTNYISEEGEPESQVRGPMIEKKEAVRKMLTRRSTYVLKQMRKPNEWDVTQLIAPSDNDYRNDPAYMISVTSLAEKTQNTGKKLDSLSSRNSFPLEPNQKSKTRLQTATGWRNDIKRLFDHYEYHCSLSYRRSACLPDASNGIDQSDRKDNETNHGGSGTGSSNVTAPTDRLHRRQRRLSNFSRVSAFTDGANKGKMRSRRSSILSQQGSAVMAGIVRAVNAPKECTRTVSSDSTRSSSSSQKIIQA